MQHAFGSSGLTHILNARRSVQKAFKNTHLLDLLGLSRALSTRRKSLKRQWPTYQATRESETEGGRPKKCPSGVGAKSIRWASQCFDVLPAKVEEKASFSNPAASFFLPLFVIPFSFCWGSAEGSHQEVLWCEEREARVGGCFFSFHETHTHTRAYTWLEPFSLSKTPFVRFLFASDSGCWKSNVFLYFSQIFAAAMATLLLLLRRLALISSPSLSLSCSAEMPDKAANELLTVAIF
jgi:hypothetical protein